MDGRSLAWLALLLAAGIAQAEVSPTTLVDPAPPQQESVTFSLAPAQVGQQAQQDVHVELKLDTRTRRNTQVLEQATAVVQRDRRRQMTVTKVAAGIPTAAQVRYPISQQQHLPASPQPDVLAGKSYLCARKGKQLQVLTAEGKNPPAEEAKLVADNMALLGRPHPLATFLAGKQINIGDRLAVPSPIAQELLGLDDQFGEVGRFVLTLKRIQPTASGPRAEFLADVEASQQSASQMRLMIAGPMVINPHGCHVCSAQLSGPIGMSKVQHDPNGPVQIDSTGRLALQLTSVPGFGP